MLQHAIGSCWPWVLLVITAVVVARILIAISGAQWDLQRLRSINRCQEGSVQSLAFVLTLPFFVMIIMLIIQASQVMIANVAVHYSAYAAARSASVWIPANVNIFETANRISSIDLIESTSEGSRYRIAETGDKFSKIRQAAVLAVMSQGPSRDLGYTLDGDGNLTHESLSLLYLGLDPESISNGLISQRLRNKLAYSYANTDVDVTFWHRVGPFPTYQDPPLQETYLIPPHWEEYQNNELGWQDHLTATVSFNVPLLPGPLRFFANGRQVGEPTPTDSSGETYIFPISASATLMIEGEKPLITHWQGEF
jgi:hypothetical protein